MKTLQKDRNKVFDAPNQVIAKSKSLLSQNIINCQMFLMTMNSFPKIWRQCMTNFGVRSFSL
ncbi:hypothetical protein X798_01275 [Onchocerca flexuosa]|uniref:Uncharacterized protein n=1 Tax=Onchocerca flexuosa TaxID=387005 RepID=A0A238C1S0_9BILA|nr:hypothetical protein X798_01275 [Onchocerca flexuosa]